MAIRAPSRARVRFATAVLSAVCSFPSVGHAASPVPDRVSLSEETITWSTVKYATDAEDGFVSGSLDKKTMVDSKFGGSTGIEATYYVTLKADRAAFDARVVLKNPQPRAIPYEYWTCTTLAPGSDVKNPKTTGGAEIIAPILAYSTPAWSTNLSGGDESLGPGRSRFAKLRYFRNCPARGIA